MVVVKLLCSLQGSIKLNKMSAWHYNNGGSMKATPTKTVITNAVVTFVQAAVAFLAVNSWDYTNKTVIAGAVGSALSVVWNTIIKPWAKEKGWL